MNFITAAELAKPIAVHGTTALLGFQLRLTLSWQVVLCEKLCPIGSYQCCSNQLIREMIRANKYIHPFTL
jgi:hypothetical protein